MSTHIQYIGSDPTWGPQQQMARRHLIEQSSITLGLADADPNVKDRDRDVAANPYQLRWRDPTVSAIQANVQWRRKKLSSNELGTTDADPNIKPDYQDSHQRRHLDPAYAVLPTYAWLRKRLSTNELGTTNADASVKPPWADGAAAYWPAPRQPDAVLATNLWRFTRLTTNDLGTGDADPTVQMPWIYEHPFPLYKRDPTVSAIEAVEQARRKRLSTNELGLADADPTIRPNYQDPHQRRHGDPAYNVVPIHLWLRRRLSTNELGTTDADPNIRPPPLGPVQRRLTDYTPYVVRHPYADQSDQVVVIPPAPTPDTSQPGGRNAANPREWALHQAQREQLRREDDEILFLL